MMLVVCCALLGLALPSISGAGTNNKGSWQFPLRFPPYPCIVLNAQIDLYLTYTDNTGTEVDTVVHVLPTSTVDEDQSTCGKVLTVQNQSIFSQILHINLDQYRGWSVRFAFTKDSRLNAAGEFALYQVNVTADYPATKTLFTNAPDSVYNYFLPVDLKNVPTVADTIYAHLNKSLACTAAQKFIINNDPKKGPLASFKLSYLQVEAFKVTTPQGDDKFDPKEICPRDQNVTDIVPIIVGSCLAGLVVITMVTYLIYRCQLPSEVLQLTGTHSRSSHVGPTDHPYVISANTDFRLNSLED
ncbi:hypothetical protein V3C99_007859 [Haemonchus contortus]